MRAARLLLVVALLGPIESLDRAVDERVQAARRPGLERVMHGFTDVGRPVWVISGLLALGFLDPAGGVAAARGCFAVLVPVNLAVEGLKWSVNRTRPDGARKRSNSSFPSSHAANAAAIAWMLSRRWPRSRAIFVLLAALVSFSRLYLHRHYLSDVLFGAALGLVLPWMTLRFWPALDPRRANFSVVEPPGAEKEGE